VEPKDAQVILGGGSLYGIDLEQGRAAVGYWLAPSARGRGVATHATRLMARWAFEGLGVARLELTCGPVPAITVFCPLQTSKREDCILNQVRNFRDHN